MQSIYAIVAAAALVLLWTVLRNRPFRHRPSVGTTPYSGGGISPRSPLTGLRRPLVIAEYSDTPIVRGDPALDVENFEKALSGVFDRYVTGTADLEALLTVATKYEQLGNDRRTQLTRQAIPDSLIADQAIYGERGELERIDELLEAVTWTREWIERQQATAINSPYGTFPDRPQA